MKMKTRLNKMTLAIVTGAAKGNGKIISELEKNERIDKNLLKYLTVKVKKFDLETDYFKKNDERDLEKKPRYTNEKKK